MSHTRIRALLAAVVLSLVPAVASEPDASWLSAVRRDVADAEYEITWQTSTPFADLPASWHAPNRAHAFRTHFTPSGIRIVPRSESTASWEWRLSLNGWGAASIRAEANRIEYDRGGLIEWYVNDERGLKQGFTIADPPPYDSVDAPLVLDMTLGGELNPQPSEDGQAVVFTTGEGSSVLRYAGLEVWDARGESLAAQLVVLPRGIQIRVETAGATYPITVDPLLTFPAWTAEGNQDYAGLGVSVATAGDVDGDGYSDVIVGANRYDNGDDNEGKAWLYHGSASGLATSAAWSAEGNFSIVGIGAGFGISVATAGDVNGDGYDDVVVGANNYGINAQGRAFLFLGSASGLSLAPAWTADGSQTEYLGQSVASAGDVNGDGFADVIVGAPRYSDGQSGEGRALVYLGSASGLAGTPAWTTESNGASAQFGYSVSSAGDVNGDGFSDIIVGSFSFDNDQIDEGRAYVYHGSASGPSGSADWIGERGQAGARYGISVASAGDVNGDGFADVLIGANGHDHPEPEEGRAYLYLGSESGLAAAPAWITEADQEAAKYGVSVAMAGDVNGDGFSDVIVGAERYDNGEIDEGRAFVYLGSASGLANVASWTAEGNQLGAHFGYSVASAGDVDGDGFSDVIVGAESYDNGEDGEGRAFVYLGSVSGLSKSSDWSADGGQDGADFGISVATAGDVNGDGFSDVIVGADEYDNGEADEGRAFVYHGSASGISSSSDWSAESNLVGARFGRSVASAGDLNGDGYSDVVVGADGRAQVYVGSPAGLAVSSAWSAEGDPTGADFGVSVASAGDVNGDGFSDLIVGADDRAYVYVGSAAVLSDSADWSVDSGATGPGFGRSVSSAGDVDGDGFSDVIVGADDLAFVYLGSASGVAASAAWSAEGDEAITGFGVSVAGAGDVNGDGYSDVVVGADDRVLAYIGSAAGLSLSPDWTVGSQQVGAGFGNSVASAGDVNGDGFSDVIVGANRYNNGQITGGRAFVYAGSASGLSLFSVWFSESDQDSSRFGTSVAGAGDVNGDGFSDVIVGAVDYDNGESDEGRTFVFFGNDGGGLDRTPRQARLDDSAPLHLLGRSDSETAFRLKFLGRSPAGRGRVRLQWEVEPVGTPFDGSGFELGAWHDTGAPAVEGSAVTINEIVGGLDPATPYHWRARLLTDSPFFPRTHWMSPSHNGSNETDLRTAGCRDADGDGHGSPPDPNCTGGTENDCNDSDPDVYPGATEFCDGLDNDCDDIVDNVLPPSGSPALGAAKSGTDALLDWTSQLTATSYDVVRGDVATLRASGGDFTPAIDSCVANDWPATSVTAGGPPLAGEGFFYLVRGSNCGGVGSYDSGGGEQVGLRDAEIDASVSACP